MKKIFLIISMLVVSTCSVFGAVKSSVHSDRAISLMQTIFKTDIVDSGDYVPNEHINTKTGENLGFAIQGWNADLFGLMYFGLRHKGLSFKL